MTPFFEALEAGAKAEISKFETFFDADVWPYVKEFFAALLSQEGKDALTAAIAALPEAAAGNFAGAAVSVAAAVTSTLAANAAADAQAALGNATAQQQ